MIEKNIKQRAIETGRDIPEELREAISLDSIGMGINRLVHLVDLVASVRNNPSHQEHDSNSITEPVLSYVSMVDRSGNWDLIRELTSATT